MLFKRLKENGKDSKFLDLDFMQPYGITPFKFGLITIIWTIVVFGFGVFAVLDQTMSTELWLVLLLVPEISFFVFKKLTEWSFNEIIVPLTNVVHSYNMIIEAKPTYRTIFGYNARVSAPEFKVDRLSPGNDNKIKIRFYPNGCRNPDVDLLHALQQEFPVYTVIKVSNRPKTYLLTKEHLGRRMTNDDFLN